MIATIRIDYDKNGKKLAYRWDKLGMRWFRMSLDKAELLIATCSVKEVIYGPDMLRYGVETVREEKVNGMTFYYTRKTE